MDGGGLWSHGRGRVLLVCWLGWVFDFFDLILFAFVKAAVGDDLGLDLVALGWVDGATLLATAVGGFAFGRLADRRGRRFALGASILCYSLGAGATALASDFSTLLLARVVTGLGVGGEWGIGHALVAERFPERLRDRAHGILQAGSPVAMALAAVVGCFAAPVIGWRACFALAALPALLALALRWALPDDAAPVQPRTSRIPATSLFAPGLRRAGATLFALLLLHMTGFWCVYAWLPNALLRQGNADLATIGIVQVQINAVHVVADVAFGWLAGRFGRVRMLVVFCLLFTAGQLLVGLTLPTLLQDQGTLVLAIALMGIGAGTWSCFGALFGAHYPAELRATAASTCYSTARGAQLFSQPLMAWLFTVTGSFAPALFVGAACSLLSAAVALALPRGRIGQSASRAPSQ